jgi:two-component system, sensor histidine kinase YesM
VIVKWYKRWIGRFIFRKLNIGIGLSLLIVFVLLGLITRNSFYTILENKEQELLNIRTEKLRLQLLDTIERFKRETMSIYQDNANGQQMATYEYFLPENVPSPDNNRQLVLEQNHMKSVLSLMLSRNPQASAVLFFRLEDGRLFEASQQQQFRINPSFNLNQFFGSFPKDYGHPYFGTSSQFFVSSSEPNLYFVNPIFNLSSIRPDHIYGYYLMALDARTLTEEFNPQQNPDNRLIIKQNETVLLDSLPGSPSAAVNDRNDLIRTLAIDSYDMKIIGVSHKSALREKLTSLNTKMFLILGVSWLICVVLIHGIQNMIVGRFNQMSRHFKKVQTNPFTTLMRVSGDDEISDLMVRLNRMTSELQNHINRVYVSEIRKRNAEFIALKSQIHPHFLYNTLESLRMQAVINDQPTLAEKLYRLGKLFRWMLQPTDEVIPVREELVHTEYFLDLLMLGKSNSVRLRVESSLNLESCYMLKFTLQPIIENAIQHGKLEHYDDPLITILITRREDILMIEVLNNGQEITPDEQINLLNILNTPHAFPEQHLGLKNIQERIKNYFGDDYGLFLPEITESAQKFRIIMKIPYKN